MSLSNKMRYKSGLLVGKAKVVFGKAASDPRLVTEGRIDQARNNAKQLVEKARGYVRR